MAAKAKHDSGVWAFRQVERRSLLQAFLALAMGFLTILMIRWANAPSASWPQFVAVGIYAVSLVTVHLVFVLTRFRGDPTLVVMTLLLGGIGVLLQERMGTYGMDDGLRVSALAYPIGVAVMLGAALLVRRRGMAVLETLAIPAAIVVMITLAIILVLGRRYRGMLFMPGNANPAEIVKPLLIVFAAGFLSRTRKGLSQSQAGLPAPPMSTLLGLAVFWGIPMALLVVQRDIGMIVLLNVVLVVMLFVATGRWGYPVTATCALVALGALLTRMPIHGQQRFLAWVDPFRSPTGYGWQVLQSLSALYTGGVQGTGLGMGFPDYVPIVSSDFVYAAIGEELGYVGCVLVVAAYLVYLYRAYRIAITADKPFRLLLATGLASMVAFQVVLNVGGVTKALPLTGITLPFLSHGGSSLVTCFLISGILLGLSDEPDGKVRTSKRTGRKSKPKKNTARRTG